MPPLGERAAQASSFAHAIRTSGQPRQDAPAAVAVPPVVTALAIQSPGTENANQRALDVLAAYLEEHEMDAPDCEGLRMAMEAAPALPAEQTRERLWAFIEQQSTKAPRP